MAKRKEINIFNISFVGLLRRALAVVIILFMVVAKMNPSSQEVMQNIDLKIEESFSVLTLTESRDLVWALAFPASSEPPS